MASCTHVRRVDLRHSSTTYVVVVVVAVVVVVVVPVAVATTYSNNLFFSDLVFTVICQSFRITFPI